MLKVVVALLVATTVAAFSAVIFSLDAVTRASAADRDTVLAEPVASTTPTVARWRPSGAQAGNWNCPPGRV